MPLQLQLLYRQREMLVFDFPVYDDVRQSQAQSGDLLWVLIAFI